MPYIVYIEANRNTKCRTHLPCGSFSAHLQRKRRKICLNEKRLKMLLKKRKVRKGTKQTKKEWKLQLKL